jgi:hypothetical protein
VEFALVLPMLLVLLLGIADFGRVMAAGITIEAAARDGAEAAAQEYVQRQRNDPAPLTGTDYDEIREIAHQVACEEASRLPNRAGSGTTCTMPVTAVCIHDDEAPGDSGGCGTSSGTVDPACTLLSEPWDYSDQIGSGNLPFVEVRICYRFTTLFNLVDLQLPLAQGISVGEVWLQRDRSFVAGDY